MLAMWLERRNYDVTYGAFYYSDVVSDRKMHHNGLPSTRGIRALR